MVRLGIIWFTLYLIPGVPAGYGQESDAFSDDGYSHVLESYVDELGRVDYRSLQSDPGDLQSYLMQMENLDRSEYESWSAADRIAFWINAYNSLTLKVIIDHYPVKASLIGSLRYPSSSIRQIPGVWKKITFQVMERDLTLDHIEHEILRKEFNEPRIHMALVCAALSCPFLNQEPYEGARLDQQLDDQTVRFLSESSNFRIDRNRNRVLLSSIFEWFGEDFIDLFGPESGYSGHSSQERAVLHFISRFLSDQDSNFLASGSYRVRYLDYDWTLNDRIYQ